MHYPDESYVRLYTRKTLTSRMLRWEGRAVMHAMLGGEEFDRAGVFAYVDDPAECIALVTELPVEVVRIGLERLLATKTWQLTDAAIVWPNYVEAQTCPKSDKARQAECRKRRNDEARRPEPTLVSRPEPPPRHAPSRAVTPPHAPSHDVTPNQGQSQPDLIPSDPDRARAQEREILPRLGSDPPPSSATRGRRWASFPEGWRDWSLATTAAAVALGLTPQDLAGHVDYWTPRDFPGGAITDLDFELRRGLDGIAERKRKAERKRNGESNAPPGAPPATVDPYAWAPIAAHRTFAKAHRLDLARAADAFRAARVPDELGTLKANDAFMRRLEWWAENGGEFPATGKLPRRESTAPRKAVGQ